MHKIPESPGNIIKAARLKADITMEKLADSVGITERYLYRIENEGKKPSFDVLYKLIRELAIDPRQIFMPELESVNSEVEELLLQLCSCDPRSLKIIKAVVQALLDHTPEQE